MARQLAQDHTAGKRQCQDLKAGNIAPGPVTRYYYHAEGSTTVKFQNTLPTVLYDLLKPGVAILPTVHTGPHPRPRAQGEPHADSHSHLHTQLSSLRYPVLQI